MSKEVRPSAILDRVEVGLGTNITLVGKHFAETFTNVPIDKWRCHQHRSIKRLFLHSRPPTSTTGIAN